MWISLTASCLLWTFNRATSSRQRLGLRGFFLTSASSQIALGHAHAMWHPSTKDSYTVPCPLGPYMALLSSVAGGCMVACDALSAAKAPPWLRAAGGATLQVVACFCLHAVFSADDSAILYMAWFGARLVRHLQRVGSGRDRDEAHSSAFASQLVPEPFSSSSVDSIFTLHRTAPCSRLLTHPSRALTLRSSLPLVSLPHSQSSRDTGWRLRYSLWRGATPSLANTRSHI
jgi:hypothetical protein